jgi:hypothetical protein
MKSSTILASLLSILSPLIVFALALAIPAIRLAVGKYFAGLVQHHFDNRIERLKSDLRQSEDKFRAELRANEQAVKSLTETALSLRSTRQVAFDARRLVAVEKLWAAKIATDKWRLAAQFTSILNLDEVFKAAEEGDVRIRDFAAMLEKSTGLNLEKDAPQTSALQERPFLPPYVWTVFSAYQSVMLQSVMILKVLATETTKYWKREDNLKPLMLLALPEYKDYIEKYGFSGYYYLIEPLEQKLLGEIAKMLDGKEADAAALKRSAEIISEATEFRTDVARKIPKDLQGPEIPPPRISG